MRTVVADGLPIGEAELPRIMGVLNVSPESPYDPSIYTEAGEAAAYVDELIEAGADVIDVGLESANKRTETLSVDDELERLSLAADAIASVSGDAVFSLETRYHEVAEAGIDAGFTMINDICGFADPHMPTVCADYDVPVVKMASPPDLTRPGALESVDAIHEALQRNGFTDKTIIDPAFGGWSADKSLKVDRETFRRLPEFRAYGRPILVSINRKNFLRKPLDRSTEEALPASVAATAMAIERGVSLVRTHDVAPTRDAARIASLLGDSRAITQGSISVTQLDTRPRSAFRRQLGELGVDRANADDWSWHIFALEGDPTTLAWLADEVGGGPLEIRGETPLVIAGPRRGFLRLRAHVEEAPPAVTEAIETLIEAVLEER